MTDMVNQNVKAKQVIIPGFFGRIGRIMLGLLLGWYAIRFSSLWLEAIRENALSLHQQVYTPVVQKGNLFLYALALFSIYFLPIARRPIRLMVALGLVAMCVLLDYLLLGDWWGLPLAVLLSLMILLEFIWLSVTHILAGVIANPG